MDSANITDKQILWERKLLDFSLRNNLLNTKLGKKTVPFVSFDNDKIENLLQSNTDFSLQAFIKPKTEPMDDGMYNSVLQASDIKQEVSEAVSKKKLISYLTESELADSVKYIYRASRTALEENGTNSLFLAIGLLKWFEEGKNSVPRYAPVLLLPVDIIRKGGQNNYVIRSREEDKILNITLTEFLKQQFHIDLSFLNPLPADQAGIDVNLVLNNVRQAISQIKEWEVKEETLLGLFSFNKFVMYNDIHSHQDILRRNGITESLIEGKITSVNTQNVLDMRNADKNNSPADFAVPMDADSSQLNAVIESANDKSFILYGPPGTGKSQTITNIIANALYHGKRVLFVAEKMAALEVVQKRLKKIGLAPFCLELHSNKVTKKHFLEQMQRALDVTKIQSDKDYGKTADEIFAKRKSLIHYAEALHVKHDNGFSLYDLINEYLAINCQESNIVVSDIKNVTADDVCNWKNEIPQLENVIRIIGRPDNHPLKGLKFENNNPDTFEKIKKLLDEYIREKDENMLALRLESLLKYCQKNFFEDKCFSFDEVCKMIEEHRIRQEEYKNAFTINKLKADDLDIEAFTNLWQKAKNKNFITSFFAKNKVFKQLKPYGFTDKNNIDNQLETVRKYQLAKQNWEKNLEEKYNFLDSLKPYFQTWTDNFEKINDWYHWINLRNKYEHSPFVAFFDNIEKDNVSVVNAVNSTIKKVYHDMIVYYINNDEQLRSFNGIMFDGIIEKYRKYTSYFQELTKRELYCRLASNIPSQTMEAVASSEMGILKRNILNNGRGNSIRSIIDKIPALLPKLTPCMLMSPISVAQFLSFENDKFDLVIFDEASQMPTSEAVGAVARGKNLIVVGDPKQMPPTSFFSATQTDDEQADIDDMESILDDCISLSLPEYYLSWHYRSKHESLIAFSNTQYYDSRLYTFPSVDDNTAKVRLVQTKGTYDKGRTRSNVEEAKAISAEVIRRLQDKELRKRSIGIVAFSKAQQNLIEDILENDLSAYPELENIAYNSEEPVFVKNLENVQGDERDIILFSIGYGPDKDGKVSMNFGPLNNNGGERRLNVAVSRARYEMIVFSALKPEHIDLSKTSSKGVEGLKAFLQFAQTGRMPQPKTELSQTESNDNVINQLADALQQHGYEVRTNIGRSKFKIDLAVIDKNNTDKYSLGILCDGNSYYAVPTVRDREVVQRNVLNMLDWNIMRIWTVDWYKDKQRVIRTVLEKLSDIEKSASVTSQPIAQDYKFDVPVPEKNEVNTDKITANTKKPSSVTAKRDIAEVPATEIINTVNYVLNEQISLPKEDLKKTVSQQLGFARMGTNISNSIENILLLLQKQQKIEISEDNMAVKLKQ